MRLISAADRERLLDDAQQHSADLIALQDGQQQCCEGDGRQRGHGVLGGGHPVLPGAPHQEPAPVHRLGHGARGGAPAVGVHRVLLSSSRAWVAPVIRECRGSPGDFWAAPAGCGQPGNGAAQELIPGSGAGTLLRLPGGLSMGWCRWFGWFRWLWWCRRFGWFGWCRRFGWCRWFRNRGAGFRWTTAPAAGRRARRPA